MNKDLNTQNEIQLVAFKLAKEEYALPIEYVQEIIMPQIPTHIPKTPDFIEGIISLRGNVIPVIDSRKRFKLTSDAPASEERIIIIELSSHTLGLIVDSLSEVIHLNKSDIEPPPIDFKDNDFITGVGKFKQRLLIILNPEHFLSTNEFNSLKKISDP